MVYDGVVRAEKCLAKGNKVMTNLNVDWKPEFGFIYTWFAMDKNGKIAVLVNNSFGDLPKKLLEIDNIENYLDYLSEFIWEESDRYPNYPPNKLGSFVVDYFSKWRNKEISKELLEKDLLADLKENINYSEVNLSANKGFFVYHAIEGNKEGGDYPIGYNGETIMGDYFRYLMPTIYGSIEDFPEELRKYIVVSENLDFTIDRILINNQINTYFNRLAA